MQVTPEVQVNWWQKTLVEYFTIWATLVVLVVVVLPGWLLVWPKFQEWRTMTKAQTLDSRLAEERQNIDSLKQKLNEWSSIKNKAGSDLQAILPSTIDIPDLLVQLEAVAAQSGFRFLGVSISEAAVSARSQTVSTSASDAGGVRPVKITFNLEGNSYANFKALLENIRSSWRLLEINSFSFSESQTSYSLDLTSYYYPR